MQSIKSGLLGTLNTWSVRQLVRRLPSHGITVFMLHRFVNSRSSWEGTSERDLRTALDELRRLDVRLISLDEIVDGTMDMSGISRPLVAFSVDDGYSDMLEIGQKVFCEYDCPFTGFVVPGAIDSDLWFWWDRVEYLFRNTSRSRFSLPKSLGGMECLIRDERDKTTLQAKVCEDIKLLSWSIVGETIEDLSIGLEVALPSERPSMYKVATWEELRQAEGSGGRFGAHTMTHPILSRCSDSESEWEIVESIRRLGQELVNPSRVFCYPNGRAQDMSEREYRVLSKTTAQAAVTTVGRSLNRRDFRSHMQSESKWLLPRTSLDMRRGAIVRDVFLNM